MITSVKAHLRVFSTYSKNTDLAFYHSRVIGIKIRQALTNEWALRGVNQKDQFIKLTNHISMAAFEMTPSEMKKAKGLDPKASLRDHMSDIELSLIQLAEVSTLELIIHMDPKGYNQNFVIAGYGGEVAGVARRVFEKKTGIKVCCYKDNRLV